LINVFYFFFAGTPAQIEPEVTILSNDAPAYNRIAFDHTIVMTIAPIQQNVIVNYTTMYNSVVTLLLFPMVMGVFYRAMNYSTILNINFPNRNKVNISL
jgi:hypothetical protein